MIQIRTNFLIWLNGKQEQNKMTSSKMQLMPSLNCTTRLLIKTVMVRSRWKNLSNSQRMSRKKQMIKELQKVMQTKPTLIWWMLTLRIILFHPKSGKRMLLRQKQMPIHRRLMPISRNSMLTKMVSLTLMNIENYQRKHLKPKIIPKMHFGLYSVMLIKAKTISFQKLSLLKDI